MNPFKKIQPMKAYWYAPSHSSLFIVSKMIFSLFVLFISFSNSSNAQKTESGTALIISTTSKAELDKIKESLKDVDPSSYRIVVNAIENGKKKTIIIGSAPLSEVNKISSVSKINFGKGDFTAMDIMMFAIGKNQIGRNVLNEKVLKQLNSKLSSSAKVDFNYQLDKSTFKVISATNVKQ